MEKKATKKMKKKALEAALQAGTSTIATGPVAATYDSDSDSGSDWDFAMEPDPAEQHSYDMAYDRWKMKMKDYYDTQKSVSQVQLSVFAVIWSQCSQGIQTKVEAVESFEDIKEDKDVLALLAEVKKICLAFEIHTNIATAANRATGLVYQCTQAPGQRIEAYYKTFKSRCDVQNHYDGGIDVCYTLVALKLGLPPAELRLKILKMEEVGWSNANMVSSSGVVITRSEFLAAKVAAIEERKAALFLDGANQERYGLQNDLLQANDGYPKTLIDCYSALVNYKHPTLVFNFCFFEDA